MSEEVKTIRVEVPVPGSEEKLEMEFYPVLIVVKRKRVRTKSGEYIQYYANIPKWLGELLDEEIRTEFNALPMVALVRPAEWYHILNWREIRKHLKATIPEKIKKELMALGFWE